MNFKFEDLFDFTASTGDWMSIIEGFLRAIEDLLAYFGIILFKKNDTSEPATEETT